jgi:hypothetical protein
MGGKAERGALVFEVGGGGDEWLMRARLPVLEAERRSWCSWCLLLIYRCVASRFMVLRLLVVDSLERFYVCCMRVDYLLQLNRL